MYIKMLESGYSGDNFTYPTLLKASTHLSSSKSMIPLHAQVLKTGFSDHVFVETALLTAYAAFGYVENARKLFDKMSNRDIVAWNSMLDVYASAGQMENAIKHFNLMPVKDNISFNIMISGYAKIGSVESAREIFEKILVRDLVSWNSMISAYTKAGEVENARKLFHRMVERNLVSWNTMITGYLDNELYTDAINLFFEMKEGGFEPNHITLATVLSSCAHLGSVEKGREIHMYAGLIGLAMNPHIVTALIDMYAKCGNINGALQVFCKSQVKDITCWNAMISGLALHGDACSALKLFHDLQNRNMKPDDITFIGLLTACSHAGLIDDGHHLFECMEKDYGISPKSEHYGCMVDLYGRAGFLQSAYRLIKMMPFEPGVTVYGALLGACVVHRNLEMGKIVAEHIIRRVDGLSDGEYMMLANMYASCGNWEEANRWRRKMNDAGISKTAGYSMIEINGRMVKFLAGDIEQVSLDKQ
ncbi:Pentatricopeptide repeat [Macleaya cordata]|uniref:Pentatricopeptide repeat n=1 Tax=Macleaya cordata TaxID=56857 RepID=A0A200PT29_MACCD|nr:Pentatricopeptide repeat [Macleaya cordata]